MQAFYTLGPAAACLDQALRDTRYLSGDGSLQISKYGIREQVRVPMMANEHGDGGVGDGGA